MQSIQKSSNAQNLEFMISGGKLRKIFKTLGEVPNLAEKKTYGFDMR